MKTLTMRSMIAVAALSVAAAGASAQTYTADVPMAFRAGDKLMAPGTYQFYVANRGNGQPILSIRNLTTSSGAVVLASPGKDAPRAWRDEGRPVITFDCLGSNCALSKLWNATGTSTYAFPGLKLHRSDMERMASITVALTKGD